MAQLARRNRTAKAMAQVLAMIAETQPEFAPHQPRPARETDEWLWDNATEFSAALEKYYAGHVMLAGRAGKRARL
jgi:hypothetical protein